MRRSGLLLLLAAIVASPGWAQEGLSDFATDGCSLFPDGSPVNRNLWCDCCVAHDMAYWRGGTEDQRKQADQELRLCVAERTSQAFGELVYAGVRAGGLPIFPTWYRWGYGWSYGRGHKPLSEAEAAMADTKLQAYRSAHPVLTCDAERPRETADAGGEPRRTFPAILDTP